MTTVSVKDHSNPDKKWGATLINVLLVEGEWTAVVFDNYYEEIYVVPAVDLDQWAGPTG